MKKLLALAFIVTAIALPVKAQVDHRTFGPYSLVTTNSDTKTFALHGSVESIYIDNAASKTSVVLITSSEGTVFSLTSTADALYPLNAPTFTSLGANASNATQFVAWKPPFVSGDLTVRVAGAADTTGTNSTTVKVIFRR